jgi:hypothetical protein
VHFSLPARATFRAHHILHLTANSTNHEAAHHAAFSILLLLPVTKARTPCRPTFLSYSEGPNLTPTQKAKSQNCTPQSLCLIHETRIPNILFRVLALPDGSVLRRIICTCKGVSNHLVTNHLFLYRIQPSSSDDASPVPVTAEQ